MKEASSRGEMASSVNLAKLEKSPEFNRFSTLVTMFFPFFHNKTIKIIQL